MNKLILVLLIMLMSGQVMKAAEMQVCTKHSDCNEDEICVSYANCQGQQVRRCLPRTCYRSGVGCPSDIVCNDKHCAVLGCKA